MLANSYKKLLKRKEDELEDAEEFEAYKDLIAGSSSEEDSQAEEGSEAEAKEQERIDQIRAKLLGGLNEDKEMKGKRKGDSDESE